VLCAGWLCYAAIKLVPACRCVRHALTAVCTGVQVHADVDLFDWVTDTTQCHCYLSHVR
jgi:hypothetical protein